MSRPALAIVLAGILTFTLPRYNSPPGAPCDTSTASLCRDLDSVYVVRLALSWPVSCPQVVLRFQARGMEGWRFQCPTPAPGLVWAQTRDRSGNLSCFSNAVVVH
jgi:hypothetical protein